MGNRGLNEFLQPFEMPCLVRAEISQLWSPGTVFCSRDTLPVYRADDCEVVRVHFRLIRRDDYEAGTGHCGPSGFFQFQVLLE